MAYHHFENGFDEKLDYQTLEEAEKAAQGYVDGTMESDGFAYDGAAIYDQQARKHLRIYGNYPDERAHAEVLGRRTARCDSRYTGAYAAQEKEVSFQGVETDADFTD